MLAELTRPETESSSVIRGMVGGVLAAAFASERQLAVEPY
jgi:hypothetical protein